MLRRQLINSTRYTQRNLFSNTSKIKTKNIKEEISAFYILSSVVVGSFLGFYETSYYCNKIEYFNNKPATSIICQTAYIFSSSITAPISLPIKLCYYLYDENKNKN